MLATRLSPYLQKLTKTCPAIARQFMPSPKEGKDEEVTFSDPLIEEHFTATRGLVHKYQNRVLILLTMNCAAYCRFCTRRRKVSDIEKGVLTDEDFDNMVKYIIDHPDIKEVIFSGGDPLTVPAILAKAFRKIANLPQIKVVRVGSRLPVANPAMVNDEVVKVLKLVKNKPLYLMLHFEHPAEITPATVKAVQKLQTVSSMMFSQSVFLKGVNDSVEVLYDLFSRLIEIGIKPYYIYRCDPVKGAENFIIPFEKEVRIFTELRKKISGLACPTYVIDSPNGSGKVPVALDFWKCDRKKFKDFCDDELEVVE